MTQEAVSSNNIAWRAAKGWLKDAERQLLFELASRLPGYAIILNIGVEYGASLACLRAGNPDAAITGVDIDCSKAVSSYECDLIEQDSHKLVETWSKDVPLSLIFVDGDHGKAGVMLDAQFADFLKVGCHILFQDCWDWDDTSIVHRLCGGVNAAVDEWFAAHNLEFEELPSVETTRVFKRIRVKEHEQPARGITHSSGADTDLRETGSSKADGPLLKTKADLRRSAKNTGR